MRRTERVSQQELEDCRADVRKAKSIRSPDWIVCLECGCLLKRVSSQHLRQHNVGREEYKEKWGYNRGSGLASARVSAARSRVAKRRGLAWAGSEFRKSFQRGHGGYARRREGALNVKDLHAGKPKFGNRKHVNGESVSDFDIAEARLRGDALGTIATRTGLSETAILFRLRRLRFPSNSGRRAAFEHGEAATGQAIADLLEDAGLSAHELAGRLGLSASALYPHLRRPSKTIPFGLARAVRGQRRFLPAHPPSASGGRPPALPPSVARRLPAKYRELKSDLDTLHRWLKCGEAQASRAAIGEWACRQTRAGTVRTLLFWPRFFAWVQAFTTMERFASATWQPQELAFRFLAEEFGVSVRTIAGAVYGQVS